ncbi:MAG TPA: protein translocase subunit SecD [Aeromonadales bacterium]|nr:protein translocase subunit SecD [Aeromonadales bacterium]
MNTYPMWKYLLVVFALIIGVLYSLPNIYGEDPSIQISPDRKFEITQEVIDKSKKSLAEVNLSYKKFEVIDGKKILIRFNDINDQLAAQNKLRADLDEGYIVALNLAPATPKWLDAFNAKPMKLGLDLRGGIHFKLEVDMDVAIAKREQQYVDDLKSTLREEKIRYHRIDRAKGDGVNLSFRTDADRVKALDVMGKKFSELKTRTTEKGKYFIITARISQTKLAEIKTNAVKQNMTTIRSRINQLGVSEPQVYREGNRIVVQLPGVQDSAQAKKVLSATASLEFRLVKQNGDIQAALKGKIPADSELFEWRDNDRLPSLLKKKVIVTGDHITNANTGVDENGLPQVSISLDSKGGSKMTAVSKRNIGKPMATVFIEYKTKYENVNGIMKPIGKPKKVSKIISIATIQTVLGSNFRITGIDSAQEAHTLAILLRAGALTAPITIVEERTIGPSLGKDNIAKGVLSVQIGLATVLLFMLFYYKLFGLIADLALMINLVLIVAIMSMLGATLTLPGIAGIVLTVGMAVDANVLIYERIREELRDKASIQRAIHQGYDSAFSTIMDANITTLIAAIILFAIGTGPVKGFAVTLAIGILTSMFTAIVGSRALVNLWFGGRKLKKLWI